VTPDSYIFLADLLLFIHVAFVAFVVLGQIWILLGGALKWNGVRNPWFRLAHLIGIGIVVVQAWLGIICPLTRWEMALREKAGASTYSGSFIAYWMDRLLYYDGPLWVFTLVYTLFGLSVLASWWWVRPRKISIAGQNTKSTPHLP